MRLTVVVVSAVLLMAGCHAAGERPSPAPTSSYLSSSQPTPSAAGAAVPCPPTAPTTRRSDLPDLTLHCLGSDDRRNLRQLSGRPLVLNVWASWCGPCKVELPLLARAHRDHGDEIAFLGVDVQDASAEAHKVMTSTGVAYPQLEDPRGLSRVPLGWNVGLPVTVFYDAQGKMVGRERKPFQTYAEVSAALARHLGASSKDVHR